LYLLAVLLAGLNIASWPVVYLLLQSYVPEWPEAMCIYGVTRVGTGSVGSARFLPALITALQWTKPAMVFLTGAWFLLSLADRHTRTGSLMNRVLAWLIALGLLAMADAVVEAAYLMIPKKEESPPLGCCAEAFATLSHVDDFSPHSVLSESLRPWLSLSFYVGSAAMISALWRWRRSVLLRGKTGWLPALLLGNLLLFTVSAAFMIEIAAPALLGIPDHHCLYDFIPNAPLGLAAIALAVVGTFSVGWACVVSWCARSPETESYLIAPLSKLALAGIVGYGGSALLLTTGLALVKIQGVLSERSL
jgi:hypothetical protein